MSDVDFCCVIKPAPRQSPKPPQKPERKSQAKCKKCAALKRQRDGLLDAYRELEAGTKNVIKQRDAAVKRAGKIEGEYKERIDSLTETVRRMNKMSLYARQQGMQFLNSLDGIQPPHHDTPEKVAAEIKQRFFNHMTEILRVLPE